jgi:hypothetical protein
MTLCDGSSAELLHQQCGRSDFASLMGNDFNGKHIATPQAGAPLPSGRGSVGAATKPAATDHVPFLNFPLYWER